MYTEREKWLSLPIIFISGANYISLLFYQESDSSNVYV